MNTRSLITAIAALGALIGHNEAKPLGLQTLSAPVKMLQDTT